jgi:hypothetical protein
MVEHPPLWVSWPRQQGSARYSGLILLAAFVLATLSDSTPNQYP